jgi:hypothetical protein
MERTGKSSLVSAGRSWVRMPLAPPEISRRCGSPGSHWDLAVVTSGGAFRWDNGNILGIPQAMANDGVLNYGQTYHLQAGPSSRVRTELASPMTGPATECLSALTTCRRSKSFWL